MSLTADSMTPADIAACTGGGSRNNDGGWGFGGDGWWIILLFLFIGWGGRGGYGNGFGGGNGGYAQPVIVETGKSCGCCEPCATASDVRAAVDQQTLISKLDNQTYGLADSTYALNNAITGGFASAELSRCNQQAALMAQLCAMQADSAKCCCETQRLIERGFADTNYNMATQACETRNTIQNTTRDIIDNANANSRAILDFLTQDKIATLTAENQSLKFQASQTAQNAFITANQEAQTAELIRRLGRDCPVPAYVVPNPNCCYTPQVTLNTCNNGCGSF